MVWRLRKSGSAFLFVSCGVLPWRSAALGCLAAQEGLNDNHRTTAFWARLVRGRIFGFGGCGLVWHLSGFWFGIKQAPDLSDPVAANAICKEARVADAMEAGRQDVDQEPADELIRGQAHDLHAISAFDAVVFPPEGHSVGICADEAMVGDRHTVRVTAEVGQHGLRPAKGRFGIHHPVGFAQRVRVSVIPGQAFQ